MAKRIGGRIGDVAKDFMTEWNSSKGGAKLSTVETSVLTEDESGNANGTRNETVSEAILGWKKNVLPTVGSKQLPNANAKRHRSRTNTLKVFKQDAAAARFSSNGTRLHSQPDPAVGTVDDKPRSRATISKSPETPKPKDTSQKLRATSADLTKLEIRGSNARIVQHHPAAPIVEEENSSLAILGLDFGTAFTKAVIRWKGDHHVVGWSDAVESDVPYLLPSMFSENVDGSCVLGGNRSVGWKTHDGIKLRLIESGESLTKDGLADAVVFLALVFRYANEWLRKTRSNASTAIRWQLHLGLPTSSWDDSDTTGVFRSIGQAARILAYSEGSVSRQGALVALERTDTIDRPAVDVLPEFACQLYAYLQSTERQSDLHALVDVGAGTVDIAFFNVHEYEGESILPIFSASVERLGTHYLIAALAGLSGSGDCWEDGEAGLDDKRVASKICEAEPVVAGRRRLYLSSIADQFNHTHGKARAAYDSSPAFKRGAPIRLFVCGGGGRIECIRERFERIAAESAEVLRVKLHVTALVRPDDIRGRFGDDFDRLSVAYGLSQITARIGEVLRTSSLVRLLPP